MRENQKDRYHMTSDGRRPNRAMPYAQPLRAAPPSHRWRSHAARHNTEALRLSMGASIAGSESERTE
jgi:hypothetical protein